MSARSYSSGPSSPSRHLLAELDSTSARQPSATDTPSAGRPDPRLELDLPGTVTPVTGVAATPDGLVFEGLKTLTEVTRYCPRRRGKKVHVSTVFRWALRGCRGIRLEVVDTPSGLCTSLPALQRFFDRLTADRNLPHQRPQRSSGDKRHEAVEAELQRRFGI